MRKLKLIFFWLWPRRRERASKKVIIWCQEDPNEAITKTLPPGFSLPAVTPCLLQLASGQGLLVPVPDPILLLKLWTVSLSGGMLFQVQGSSHVWCYPCIYPVSLLLLGCLHCSVFPPSTVDTEHTACTISHSTSGPAIRVYSPHLAGESAEAESNWMSCSRSHGDLAPDCPALVLIRSTQLLLGEQSLWNRWTAETQDLIFPLPDKFCP